MTNIELNDSTADEVREFFQKTISTQSQQEEFDKFLEQISPSLKLKI